MKNTNKKKKKNTKKNIQKNMLTIFSIAILAVVFYFGFTTFASAGDVKSKYVIENNQESIELGIENYLNSAKKENTYDIKMENTLDLDNKKFILFTMNNNLGFAEVSTGENGLLGVDYASFGDDLVKLNVTSTSNGRYLIAFGRNYNQKISKLGISTDGQDIELSVAEDDFYISYTKLDSNISADSSSSVNMYDNFGREITVDMYLQHKDNKSI